MNSFGHNSCCQGCQAMAQELNQLKEFVRQLAVKFGDTSNQIASRFNIVERHVKVLSVAADVGRWPMELDSKSQSSNMGGNYSGKIKQVPRQNWRVIVRAKISIRDQPGREGKVLGHIRQGDVVEVSAICGNWIRHTQGWSVALSSKGDWYIYPCNVEQERPSTPKAPTSNTVWNSTTNQWDSSGNSSSSSGFQWGSSGSSTFGSGSSSTQNPFDTPPFGSRNNTSSLSARRGLDFGWDGVPKDNAFSHSSSSSTFDPPRLTRSTGFDNYSSSSNSRERIEIPIELPYEIKANIMSNDKESQRRGMRQLRVHLEKLVAFGTNDRERAWAQDFLKKFQT